MRNHYEVLGVAQTATLDEINKRYKLLALQFHPDKASQNNLDPSQSEVMFKLINTAHEVLSDEQQRRKYDQQLLSRNTEVHSAEASLSTYSEIRPRPIVYVSRLYGEKNTLFISHDDPSQLELCITQNTLDHRDLETIFYNACREGKFKIVKYLIEVKRIDPNMIVMDFNGFFSGSVFKAACESGNLELVTYLFETHHADIESRGVSPGTNYTALMLSVQHAPVVEYLIAKGANVNPKPVHLSLLNLAVRAGNFESVRLLVDAGTDLEDHDIETALNNPRTIRPYLIEAERQRQLARLSGDRKTLSYIYVTEKPFKHYQYDRLDATMYQSFSEMLNIRFEEKLDISQFPTRTVFREDISGSLTSEALHQQFNRILKDHRYRPPLAICKINDEVGYGVFARYDICKDQVLCFYSGTFLPGHQVQNPNDEAMSYYGIDGCFSTQNHRGISSFFQHLPQVPPVPDAKQLSQLLKMTGQNVSEQDLKMDDELFAIEFADDSVRKNVATANVRREYINYHGIPVILFVTNETVKANHQLGLKYGKNYWLSRNKVPCLFDKNGSVLPITQYKRTCWQLCFNGFSYTGDLKPLIMQLQQGSEYIKLNDDRNQIQQVDATIVVSELLRVNAISEAEKLRFQCSRHAHLVSQNALFKDLDSLIKKYSLSDATQESLEKGLRNATVNNNVVDLKCFIKHVKNIDAVDANPASKRTALHWAVIKGKAECYALLCAAGAKNSIEDANGKTVLDLEAELHKAHDQKI